MAQGFSLIEALITVLVISIGLLGVAGLQLSAKQANYEAMQRTTAALLAEDMISRLRANSGELAYFVGKKVTGTTITAEPSPACSPSSPCSTAEQLAAHDLWEWEQLLIGATEQLFGTTDNTGGLMEPTGCITGPASGDHGAYTVTIAWRGVAAGSNPSTSTCGEDVARYGTDNAYRRLVSMTVYITPLAGGL
jgi:type IV pilus assembly protein PilV